MAKQSIIDRLLESDGNDVNKKVLKARKKATKIVEKAQIQAEKIVEETDLFEGGLKEKLENELSSLVASLAENIKTQAEASFAQALSDYSKNLQSSIEVSRSEIDKRIAENATQAQKELEDYKEAQKKTFQELLIKKTDLLARELLGETLSTRQQEKLISEALQKAKEDGLFNS